MERSVNSFQVATYNGSIGTASANSDPDLFWALRSGGKFRYVLEMTHKIHRINQTNLPAGQISYFNISWNNQDDFRAVFRNWIQYLDDVADADTRINFDVVVFSNPGYPKSLLPPVRPTIHFQ